MAKRISPQQAESLVERYRNLFNRISLAQELASEQDRVEIQSFTRLAASGALQDYVRHDLSTGYPTQLPPELAAIFNKTDACDQAALRLESIRRRFLAAHSGDIDLLKSTPKGLSRLVAGKKTLDDIDRAYQTLDRLFGDFDKDAGMAMEDLSSVAYSRDNDPLWQRPFGSPGTQAHVTRLVGAVAAPGLPEVEKLLSVLRTARESRERATAYVSLSEKDAKQAIEQYCDDAAAEQLVALPVETLSQMKRRVRVKTLRDNGYLTLADVYNAGPSRLQLLNGISADAAYEIQRYVAHYLSSIRADVKIRLSSDVRDVKSARVVLALARYRGGKAIARAVATSLMGQSVSFAEDIAALERLNDPVSWPFIPLGDKREAIEVFRRLNDNEPGSAKTLLVNASRRLALLPSLPVEEAWGDFSDNPIAYATLLEELAPGRAGGSDAYYGLPEKLALEIQQECFFPEGLLCTLRRYQEWGVKYILHQERVLLGDEMGLGKTIQAIATMVSLRNTGATHFIVVCPASVLTNWYREIKKNSLLKAIMVYGENRKWDMRTWLDTGGVAVTTYETVRGLQFPVGTADMVVVDEAHYVKNPAAARSKAVAQLCTSVRRVLFMTGTPLENRVDEMVELIRLLRPSLARGLEQLSGPTFRQAVAPVYYRRKRKDVLSELPELIESEEWCRMTGHDERAYYSAAQNRDKTSLRRVSWAVDDLSQSSKAQRLVEIVNEAQQDGRKVLVFSFYLDTIRAVRSLLGERCTEPINGSVPPERRQRIIDDFDASGPGTVLPAQIMAGGTGLNVQSAGVVVICEPQCKPSIESQAISRAYRMGQARNVLVYRLLCPGTIDEKFHDMLDDKQKEFDKFADKSVAAAQAAEIDEKTANNLIEEEIERIKRRGTAS